MNIPNDIMSYYKVHKDKYENRVVYKEDKLYGTAGSYSRYNEFMLMFLSNDKYVAYIHYLCPMKKELNDSEELLPQVKITAYLTREIFLKKKHLLILNEPFVRILDSIYGKFGNFSDVLQIADRCNLFEIKADHFIYIWLKCDCGEEIRY